MSTSIAVRPITPATATIGEGPFWSADTGRLHWVDIPAGQVHSTDPESGVTDTVNVPTWVGAAIPREKGFVAATMEGFATIVDGELDTRLTVLENGLRSNDAKCDRSGRLWAGTNAVDFTAGAGTLRVLEPDWTTRVVLEGLTLPNGMGWSPDDKTFYFIDTYNYVLWAFDFDLAAGTLGNQRALHRFGRRSNPDGMCVDSLGYLWIAMWGGGEVVRFSPRGTVVQSVAVPARTIVMRVRRSLLSTLYVTSAREGLTLKDGALDGSVFAVTGLGVTGLPVNGFAG